MQNWKTSYEELVTKYPIISIEDPFDENDFSSLSIMTNLFKDRLMLVGDDYFVTNVKHLTEGIDKKAGNAIIIKVSLLTSIGATQLFTLCTNIS